VSEPTLAEVIREAMEQCRTLVFDDAKADHIAAAVTAWASSDAAVERMARAMCIEEGWLWESVPPTADDWRPDDFHLRSIRSTGPFQSHFLERARAAVAALLGARTP
jgi:hypothetical protein